MHSKDKLADALRKADLPEMAARAAQGYYHDFLSPLDTPALALDADLLKAGTPAAMAIRARHHNGDFDATTEESEAWAASPEGKAAMRALAQTRPVEIGRLAMRVEGDWWRAYYATADTMEGAVLLGSIALRAVADPERKHAFMALMRDVVGDILEEHTGQRPTWDDPDGRPAPEHERTGKA